MGGLDLKIFSGIQLTQIIETRNMLNTIFERNSDLFQIRKSDFYFDVFSNDMGFHFSISNLQPVNLKENFSIVSNKPRTSKGTPGDVLCSLLYKPIAFDNIEERRKSIVFPETVKLFEQWIGVVKKYNDVLNEYYDPLYKQFEKEFEDEFTFGEDDQGTAALDSDKQLKVYKLLTLIEDIINKEDQSNPEIQKLLAFTQDFKENLHTLPKSIIKKKAIQLLSKLRKKGIKLYFDTLDIGYKEIIKAGLIAAATNADHLIKLLH